MPPHNRRGNYAMITALSMTSLLGFAALAVDYSYLVITSMELRAASDAGAHAAVIELRNGGTVAQARAAAVAVLGANRAAGEDVVVDPAVDIEFGRWRFDTEVWTDDEVAPNAVRVSIRRTDNSPAGPIPLLFAPIFGEDSVEADLGAASTAAMRSREILIVQDITGSFSDEILQARVADLAFLNFVNENDFPGDRLGLIVFGGAATILEPLQDVSANYADMLNTFNGIDFCQNTADRLFQCRNTTTSPWVTYGWYDRWEYAPQGGLNNPRNWHITSPPAPAVCNTASRRRQATPSTAPLTKQLRTQMPLCSAGGGGTNQGSGLNAAIDHILDVSDDTSLRVIVLISDGEPSPISRRAGGLDAADRAEAENISIYSVSYNNPFNAVQSEYMEDLVRGYGRFYETPDENELPEILSEIARNIPISVVR